jgi:signal transduction histidine kinase
VTRLRALWRDPVNRHAAKVAAVAAAAGAAIFFLASLPAALRASGQVAAAADDQVLAVLREEQRAPGTIQSQAMLRLARGHPLVWFVPTGGSARAVDDPQTPPLPAELAGVSGPETATIAGVTFRVAGAPVDGGRVVGAVAIAPDLQAADAKLQTLLDATVRRFRAAPAGVPVPLAPAAPPEQPAWKVAAGGTVSPLTGPSTPELPPELRDVGRPVSAVIDGVAYRVAGAPVADGRIVAAVPDLFTGDSAVRNTLPFVPLVGLATFVVAFAIGRWAAVPIEDARRRQLAFTADASHELRTPLAVIEAEVTLALGRPREAAGYRDALERVSTESRRLGRLVDDLLWLARFDANPPGPEAVDVDVCATACAAVERFQPVAAARGQVLRASGDARQGARITAPREWLDKLLGVLLDNACRYSPEGGPIEVRVEVAAGRVRLAVDDAGPGIPAGEHRRIFDRFHRSTDRPGGTGLGLAIADAVVRATRGRWEIGRSAFGGTSIGVAWPPASGFTNS